MESGSPFLQRLGRWDHKDNSQCQRKGSERKKGRRETFIVACKDMVDSPIPYLSYYVFPTGLANIQRDSRLVSL